MARMPGLSKTSPGLNSSPDRFAAASASGGVAALNHKVLDDTVKNKTVVIALFDMGCEVFNRERSDVVKKLQHNHTLCRLQGDNAVLRCRGCIGITAEERDGSDEE